MRRGRSGVTAECDGGLLIDGVDDSRSAMSLRTRLLLAFAAVVLIPIALLAFGLRQEMNRRLSEEYQLASTGSSRSFAKISLARAPALPSGSRRSRARC